MLFAIPLGLSLTLVALEQAWSTAFINLVALVLSAFDIASTREP